MINNVLSSISVQTRGVSDDFKDLYIMQKASLNKNGIPSLQLRTNIVILLRYIQRNR
jgi:hypothetical protein